MNKNTLIFKLSAGQGIPRRMKFNLYAGKYVNPN